MDMEKLPAIPEEKDEDGGVAVENPEKGYADKLNDVAKWLEANKGDPHVADIAIDDLDAEDLEIFGKFKERTLSEKELADYIEKNLKGLKEGQLMNNHLQFGALMRNKLISRSMAEELRKRGIEPEEEKGL